MVVGGGRMAKGYIKETRMFSVSEQFLDSIGIEATRINAMVVVAALGNDAYNKIVKSLSELKKAIRSRKIVVMGGLSPGMTTDGVSVMAAKQASSDIIIKITDVNGVYDRDPDKYENARRIDRISSEEFLKLAKNHKHAAGSHFIIDIVALRLMNRYKIPMLVVNKDIKNIRNYIERGRCKGSMVY